MGDTLAPRPTYLLVRGQYDDHGDEVLPEGLSAIAGWNSTWPRNRLGLAEWLFDSQNPLTARVFVNRLWQQTFGRGLVGTSEDFGSQGAIPTHPELLDWLAVDFRQSAWDIKRLHKMLVMSQAFRQASEVSEELNKKDPENVYLARFARLRMSAEMIRDHALAVSGLLVQKVGGPSVYPYQPDGIWDGLSGYVYPKAGETPSADHHRRSLYSFIKRNAPHPAMAVFDFPERGSTTVRRATSNTPLQALVLLNDQQYGEAYRGMAERAVAASADEVSQITLIFRLATRRQPRPSELATLRTYYETQITRLRDDPTAVLASPKGAVSAPAEKVEVVRLAALTRVAAAVMNSPAAYTVR